RKHDVRDSRALQGVDLVKQKWPVANRNDRFWRVDRQWTQPRAFTAGQNKSLHTLIRSKRLFDSRVELQAARITRVISHFPFGIFRLPSVKLKHKWALSR